MVATPHVAGYSDEGKRNGTWMVYETFCEWAGIEPARRDLDDQGRLTLEIADPENALTEALEAACFVPRHDAALRGLSSLEPDEIAPRFDRLRREYPFRRDFHGWDIRCDDRNSARLLGELGFAVNPLI